MKYRLHLPSIKETIEFDEYKDAIFALGRIRVLDASYLEEIDDKGNVHGVVDNDELRKIVAELGALSASTVLTGKPGRTL